MVSTIFSEQPRRRARSGCAAPVIPAPVALRADLLADGLTPDELRRRRRRGELASVRRGAYVTGDDPRLTEAVAVHRLRVEAAVRQLGPAAVVSHVSAAVLLGLSCWGLPLDRVHVTRNRRSGARTGPDLVVHAAALDPDEILTLGGVTLTAPARTVVDIGRRIGFERAVAVADAALHRPRRDRPPLVTSAELATQLVRGARRPGLPAARRVVAFADGRSESVGESRSRVAIHRAGLPPPVLQWEVFAPDGVLLGRVDLAWPRSRTVGEFDGRIKYGRLLRPGQAPGDAVYAEKRREDALRAMGLTVVRWGWQDLGEAFGPTAARLTDVLR